MFRKRKLDVLALSEMKIKGKGEVDFGGPCAKKPVRRPARGSRRGETPSATKSSSGVGERRWFKPDG